MKILIIGGTRFLGRHLVTAALARDHDVTLFNRGNHSKDADVETIEGDRNTELHKLEGRRWDAVVDTCGYLPRAVSAVEVTSMTRRSHAGQFAPQPHGIGRVREEVNVRTGGK